MAECLNPIVCLDESVLGTTDALHAQEVNNEDAARYRGSFLAKLIRAGKVEGFGAGPAR